MIGTITESEFASMVGERVFQMTADMGVEVKSEANERGNWRAHAHRRSGARDTARLTTMALVNRVDISGLVLFVLLVRVGGGRMDSDNLYGAFKHVRDGVAEALGIDDGDEDRLRFYVDQEPNRRIKQTVRMTIIGARNQTTAGA